VLIKVRVEVVGEKPVLVQHRGSRHDIVLFFLVFHFSDFGDMNLEII